MNCHEAIDVLEMYITGDLPDRESLEVARHLEGCEACSAEYDRTRELVDGLRGLADSFVPAQRTAVPESTVGRRVGVRGWRLATAAAAIVALFSTSALAVPAIARQLPLPLASEFEALEARNDSLQEQVDELTVRLETIGGEEVPVVDTVPGDLPAEESAAVQTLAMAFVRAQYAGDVEALKSMSTDRLQAEIGKHPQEYLRAQGATIVFAQMTEPDVTEDGIYLLFVRLSDSVEWTDSQYQENFEIKRVGDEYLVDFMGMDA